MASSGTMQANSVNIGGNGGNYFFINWQVAGQSEDGNYSTINWQAYFHFNSADAQLDNGYASLGGATRWSNGGRVYNFSSNFTTRNLGLASGSFNIGHDGNGNRTLSVGGGVTAFQSGRSESSNSWSLPGLYQAIAFNYITFTNITDVGFTVNVQTNRTANLLQLNIDGAGFVTYYSGNYSTLSVDVPGPFSSGVAHSVTVRTRRASNNWVTDSSQSVTTDVQNKFFDIGDY